MSYIAIDLWNKRCWIASSTENIAFPQAVVSRSDIISWLKKYLSKQSDVSTIIVGLPYDLYGNDTRQLDKTQKFIEKIQDIFPKMKIIWHDERFSSFQASEGFDDHRDDIAAQCILQSYIDSRNNI